MDAPKFLDNVEFSEPSQDRLRVVRDKCRRLGNLESEISELEAQLSELKKQRSELAQKELPEMFVDLGLDIVGDASNHQDYVLKPWYKASLPREQAGPGLAWLEEHGHVDLIKCRMTVEFPKNYAEQARALANEIRERYHLGVSLDEGVHHSTLTSFVRHSLEDGDELPLELLGATVGHHVVVREKK